MPFSPVMVIHGPVMSSALLFSILLDLKGVNCARKHVKSFVRTGYESSSSLSLLNEVAQGLSKVKGGTEVSKHFRC